MYRFILLFLPAFYIGSVNAQTSHKTSLENLPVKGYTVGNKLPELVFSNMINSRSEQTKLSDYKGKLLVIDFWEWGCLPCMETLPKIQKLQKKFADQVEVITVTSLISPDLFREKLKETPVLKNYSLPTVLQDKQLSKYFPFHSISHLVWIDGNGVVKAITGSDYFTEDNIRLALRKEPVPWAVKKDVIGFDVKKSLMVFGSADIEAPAVLFNSMFTGYLDGVEEAVSEQTDTVRGVKTINFINQNIISFCDGSLDGAGYGYIYPKYMVLDVADSTRYIWKPELDYFDQWLKKNAFTYSVTIPADFTPDQQKEFIKKDLTNWLEVSGITVKKEFRDVFCYALISLRNDLEALKSNGGEPVTRVNFPYDSSYIRNDSIQNFLYYLNKNNTSIPYLFKDSTGLPQHLKVSMQFSETVFSSVEQLRKELQLYGFDLVPSSCRVEMHIISEKKPYSNTHL